MVQIPESENLTSEDIENNIISFNREIMEKDKELFKVDLDDLYAILNRMNHYNNIEDRRKRVIKKATRILAGITRYQPFHEGNRRTAIAAAISYLQQNGYDLRMITFVDQEELYDILGRTIWKTVNDPTIFGEVEEY